MSSSILIVGATGNTGPGAVKNIRGFLGDRAKNYRIIALTRSLKGKGAQKLADVPGVEIIEKNWTEIDAAWLKEHRVERAYVAPHNLPTQFMDESDLYVAMLEAKVKYVVKLATFSPWMYPSSPITYARTHWAVENLLEQLEFLPLGWTSLRPNNFLRSGFVGSGKWLERCRDGGADVPVHVMLPPDGTAAAMIEPEDVGMIAAKLLSLEDPSEHYGKRYVLSGPEDVTAGRIIDLLEQCTGVRPINVVYKSLGSDEMLERGLYPPKYRRVFQAVLESWCSGAGSLASSPTSPEITKLGLTLRTPLEAMREFVKAPATRHHDFTA